MSTRYQELTVQALTTEYAGDEVFDRCPNLKIATLVRNRSETFGRIFEKYAHAYDFDLGVSAGEANADDEDLKSRAVRREEDLPELEEVTGFAGDEVAGPEKGKILEWLKNLYHTSRGFELGTFQASILSTSMKKQSVKWDTVAMGYISDVITMVHKFIIDMLQHVCPDNRVRRELTAVLMKTLTPMYMTAIDHVSFLLQVECSENPGTLNGYFAQSLRDRYSLPS
jgi:hypothetical protein